MTSGAAALAAIGRLPVRPLSAITEAGPPLILAPHPDDESLGCGGLIASACEAGPPPFVLVITDGAGSHPNSRAYPPARLRATRQQEARRAVAALGLPPDRIGFLGLPDTQAPMTGPAFDAAVTAVASLALRIGAGTLVASWAYDPHADHEATHHIAAAAARETGIRHLSYPVWGLTLPPDAQLPGPLPTGFRLDIADWLPRKRRAIAAHRSQTSDLIADDPHGFKLPAEFLALFDQPFETFLDPG